MKRWIVLGACLAMLVALVLTTGSGAGLGGASSLSKGPHGWFLARHYLAARGTATLISDAPLGAAPSEGDATRPGAAVWVLSLPWPRPLEDGEELALRRHLADGGQVVVAYSQSLETPAEIGLLESLGLDVTVVRQPPSLWPWRWWRTERGEWELSPAEAWSGAATPPRLLMPVPRRAVRAPEGAAVLYRGGDLETPLVFSFRPAWAGSPEGAPAAGRVWVLPAALLANAGLARAGNADLLEGLRRKLGPVWRFDEYHHGLIAPEYRAASTARFAWDLCLLHLALLYILAVAALAKRFGPPWHDGKRAGGTASDFLRNLAALHRELGHHPAAARLLAERRRQYDPRNSELLQEDSFPRNDAELVRFARRLARPDARLE